MNERLVNRLDQLASDVPPSRDLWPAISARIAAETQGDMAPMSAKGSRPAVWQRPAYAMAAAVALLAVGVFVGLKIGAPPVAAPAVAASAQPGSDASVIPASMRRDAAYRQERDALLKEVQVKLNAMPPADRDKVAKSLDTLRRSITEIETQLGYDPANALLQELLVSSCQEEMRVLTTVRDSGSQEI
jgi:hypothetical protein